MHRIAARPLQQCIKQSGQAILILLAIMGIGLGAVFYTFFGSAKAAIEKDKVTAAALAQAKEALIGYAASVVLSTGARPGDLPCPDLIDIGTTGASCGNAAGTTGQAARLGRLPWKSLGLPDLRDGDGERLWYAVSNNFKYNSRTTCAAPGDAGCLNSDTRGTISMRNNAGTVVNDGSNPDPFTPSGVIAVILAPGGVLQRQGAASSQDRSCTGGTCTAAGVCATGSPAKCNPANYLDILSGVEDNADFIDGSNANGFINGVVRNASGDVIVNDRLLTITYQDLMPVLQRRVAQEVINSLNAYSSVTQNSGRYPWAAPITDVTTPYTDQTNTLFGRVPDVMSSTLLGIGGFLPSLLCPILPLLCMSSNWPASSSITQGTWWTNWKEMVLYSVASAYAPANPLGIGPVPASGGCGSCLTVNPPSTTADKRVAVIVAGKRLSGVNSGQPRGSAADKSNAGNYVEDQNNGGATNSNYTQKPASSSFNDLLLFQQ